MIGSTLLLGGCSINPKAKRAVTTTANMRDELRKASGEVETMVADTKAIADPNADLKASYKTLEANIKKAEAAGNSAAERAEDMRERASDYIAAWQAKNENLRDPDLKAAADARNKEIADGYNDYALLAGEARKAYWPFLQDLKDLKNYLQNDLTAAGVEKAKPTIQKAVEDGNLLNQRIAALANKLDSLTADLSAKPAK
jgi:hypothetical protein